MASTTTLRMILLGEDRSAGKTLKGVGDEADKSASKMDKFHKVGKAAGVALAGGLLLAGKAAVEFTKRAAEDQLASEKMAQTYRKAAGATKEQIAATEDWITAQGKAKGVTDDELRPALSKLVVATHSVSKAQKLASLAMDVSAGTGKSLESVSFALAKAQNGNVSGLSRLGVATKDATGKTLSLQAITKSLSDTYQGAASKAAETTAGKQKILTTQMGELQEKIGYELLPVMSKLVAVGMKVVDWISNNTKVAGILVGIIGGLVAVTWAVSAATKAWAAITKIAAAGQWLLNAALDANPIGLVIIAIAALVAGLIIAYKKSETFRNIVNAAFKGVQVVVGAVVGFIKDHWKAMLVLMTGAIGVAVLLIVKNWDKVSAAIKAVAKVAVWLWNGAFQPVLKFIVNGISFMIGIWAKMLNALGHVPGFGWAKDAANALQNAADKARSLADNIKDIPTHKTSTVVLNTVHNVVHTTGGHVPAFAKGTAFAPGGTALVGEEGPEVVELPRGSRVRTAAQTRSILGGGGDTYVTVNANGLVDPQQMVAKIQAELLKLKRNRGGAALGLA